METTIGVRGDSITMGAWDLEKGGRVNRLNNYFGDLFLNHGADYRIAYNLGIDGDTSDGLLKRFSIEYQARQTDIVIFAIGSNDCNILNHGNNLVSLNHFMDNIKQLYERSKQFTHKIIFVGQIICDEQKTNPIVRAPELSQSLTETKRYNDAIKLFCTDHSIYFVDMIDLLNNNDLQDGIHPNAQGHEKIHLKIREFLIKNKLI